MFVHSHFQTVVLRTQINHVKLLKLSIIPPCTLLMSNC
uniref:Uncharacterized protein n=1 Tax=Anguilla anguilla TaxID=7936 RepID=A0A0E9UF75_ANGAN